MRFKPFSEWGLPLSDRGLMLIAGPCAAESEVLLWPASQGS